MFISCSSKHVVFFTQVWGGVGCRAIDPSERSNMRSMVRHKQSGALVVGVFFVYFSFLYIGHVSNSNKMRLHVYSKPTWSDWIGILPGSLCVGGGVGGEHCLFKGRYPLPNYHLCFSGLSALPFFFYRPGF